MPRLIHIGLILLIGFTALGCGGSKPVAEETPAADASTTTPNQEPPVNESPVEGAEPEQRDVEGTNAAGVNAAQAENASSDPPTTSSFTLSEVPSITLARVALRC